MFQKINQVLDRLDACNVLHLPPWITSTRMFPSANKVHVFSLTQM